MPDWKSTTSARRTMASLQKGSLRDLAVPEHILFIQKAFKT